LDAGYGLGVGDLRACFGGLDVVEALG